MHIVTVLLPILLADRYVHAKEVWVDPHDMNVNLDAIYKSDANQNDQIRSSGTEDVRNHQHCTNQNAPSYSYIYLKRFINVLLNVGATQQQVDELGYTGTVKFILSDEDYAFLKKFANGRDEENVGVLKQVDDIFSRSLRSSIDQYSNLLMSWSNQIYYLMYNKVTAVLGITICILVFVNKLLRSRYPFWYVFATLLLFCWVVDFALTYLYLVEVQEVKQMVEMKAVGDIPPECEPSNMDWKTFIWFRITGNNPCQQFYQAKHPTLSYKSVTLLTVISHQIKILGNAVGGFLTQVFVELPWGLNIVLYPLILVFFGCMVTLTYTYMWGCKLKINILHLINFEVGPSGNNIDNQKDLLSGANLAHLLSSHRTAVEEVREQPQTPPRRRIKQKSVSPKLVVQTLANSSNESAKCGNKKKQCAKAKSESLKLKAVAGGDGDSGQTTSNEETKNTKANKESSGGGEGDSGQTISNEEMKNTKANKESSRGGDGDLGPIAKAEQGSQLDAEGTSSSDDDDDDNSEESECNTEAHEELK